MKKSIMVFSVLLFSAFAKAQSDSNYVELGINTVRIIQMGIGQTDASGPHWNPYLLTAEGHYKRLGLRLGLGMASSTMTELPSNANGKVKTNMDSTASDIRIGLNWEFSLHKKWTMKLGLDYFMAKRFNSLTTEFLNEDNESVSTLNEMNYQEKGIAPVLFFQYHITPRVSLGTELMWRFSSFTKTDSDTNNLSDNDVIREYEGTKRVIMMPTALFLIARF